MRQFIIDVKPDSKGLINLSGKDYRYIRQVLRLNTGDMMKIVIEGKAAYATICSIDESKKSIILQLCDTQNDLENESNLKTDSAAKINPDRCEFYLIQFIAKPQKMELIIRQAVEDGVSAVIPVIGEYTQKGSEKSLLDKTSSAKGRQDRIERIIREARQQCGSPLDMKIYEPVNLEKALEIIEDKCRQVKKENKSVVKISLYEKKEDSVTIHQVCADASSENKIGCAFCAVGCEGGISPDEIQLLKSSGFSTVHLDVNILRCETASLYGMAALQTTVLEGNVWHLKE